MGEEQELNGGGWLSLLWGQAKAEAERAGGPPWLVKANAHSAPSHAPLAPLRLRPASMSTPRQMTQEPQSDATAAPACSVACQMAGPDGEG